MAVRSNYIKKLMENKDSLEKQYQEVVAESMKNIIGENTKDEVRKLLKEAEDEDSYEEEEVEEPTDNVDDEVDTESGDEADDELWDDLEKCKSADGEYDCRGMEDGKLINILKAMGPEDGIRVMSNGDGTVAVEVDGDAINGDAEYIIDIDDIINAGDDVDDIDDDIEAEDGDIDVELEDDEDVDDDLDVELELNEENLGYKGHPGNGGYQGKTAMTTPKNDRLSTDRKKVGHTWEPQLDDADIDKGKDGDRQPYKKNIKEEVDECGDTVFEIEEEDGEMIDEVMSSTENNPTVRGTGMTHQNTNKRFGKKNFRNGRTGEGGQVKGTGYNSYSGDETNESVALKRSVNQLFRENKQMKSIIPQLNQKLTESMVINASMGYIVRLLNENTTTVDEKKQISDRFAKVNTLEEGKRLYETISEELRRANKRTDFAKTINGQLAEGKQSKQNLVETTMYKSEKVNEALDFMKRLDKIQ